MGNAGKGAGRGVSRGKVFNEARSIVDLSKSRYNSACLLEAKRMPLFLSRRCEISLRSMKTPPVMFLQSMPRYMHLSPRYFFLPLTPDVCISPRAQKPRTSLGGGFWCLVRTVEATKLLAAARTSDLLGVLQPRCTVGLKYIAFSMASSGIPILNAKVRRWGSEES